MTPDNPSGAGGGDNASGSLQDQNNASRGTMNLGSLLKLVGAASGGVASYNSYGSKAAADNFNAQIATGNASSVAQANIANETSLRLYQQQKIGEQRANLAEAGIGPISAGSAAGAINQSEVNANMQALSERYKGNVERTSLSNSAALDQYYAKVAKQNQETSLFDTGASATSQLLNGYSRYTQGGF